MTDDPLRPLHGVPATLRAATGADRDACLDITREAMRAYVEQTWGHWNEAEQRRLHEERFDPTTLRIVEQGGEAVGLVGVEVHADHHWLVKLYLRERARGHGLGSRLLGEVIAAANADHKPVRLRVLRVNVRAQALYLRHGFRVTNETAERLFMERAPGPES